MPGNREIFQENQLTSQDCTSRLEKLRELNENQEFICFLEQYYQYKELHYRTKGFMVAKNNFCQDIKNQRILPSSFNLRRLSVDIVEQPEVIDDQASWHSNIKFMAGNVPYNIEVKPTGMLVKNSYSLDQKPRELDLKFAPKLLVGLISASADANNHAIWNQDELIEIEEAKDIAADKAPEILKDLVGSLADIGGNCEFNVQTPVLVNESGTGMQIHLSEQFNSAVSCSKLKIDMATENPLGILVYSFDNTSYMEDNQKDCSYISRQAIDGSVRDLDLDIDLYGYKPTVIDPAKDKKTFQHITHAIDTTLCGFMRKSEIV